MVETPCLASRWKNIWQLNGRNAMLGFLDGNEYRDARHCVEYRVARAWRLYRNIKMSENRFKNKYRIPSARWADWDYGSEGAYFVTICTKHKEHYFGEIVNAEMQYSELGMIAVCEWMKSVVLRPDMELDMECFQVMPNHIHGIVVIGRDCRNDGDCKDAMHCVFTENNELIRDAKHGVSTGFGPQFKNLASIMRGFKSAITTQARMLKIPFDWQARFHDRVIRDDEEFRRIAAYIEQNPLNWENDSMN